MRYPIMLALILTSVLARAETVQAYKPLTCTDGKTLLEILDKWNEVPFISGRTEQGHVVLYANRETGSWTFIERVSGPDGRPTYCLHSEGEELKPVSEETRRGFLEQRRGRYD